MRKKGYKWLNYHGVVALTMLSRRKIGRLVAAGDFPTPIKLGKAVRFVKREILTWMEQQENRRRTG